MKLNREQFHAIIFYNFRRILTQQQCIHQGPVLIIQFNHGRSSLQDEFRESRPKSVVVPETIDVVRQLILQDRHVIYREIETNLGISGTMHEHLI